MAEGRKAAREMQAAAAGKLPRLITLPGQGMQERGEHRVPP